MRTHRLPGMSISSNKWDALAERAEALGISRTEFIRQAIDNTLDAIGDADPDILGQLQAELVTARRQLAAIKAALGETASVAAA